MRNDFIWAEISWIVRNAMKRVVDQDGDLLTLEANERAVTHRLAVYMEPAFWGWHVDCGYNRQHGAVIPEPDPIHTEDRNVSPDVIVHQRGPWSEERKNNLLVVEVKPWWAEADAAKRDMKKLLRYLLEHHFQFAAFVSYEQDHSFRVEPITEAHRATIEQL